MRPTILLSLAILALPASLAAQSPLTFTCGKPSHKSHQLSATTLYHAHTPNDPTPTFGFDISTAPSSFDHHTCTGSKPFFFSVALPEGAYTVTLTLGSPTLPTNTTVRGEARRLFVNQLSLPAKKTAQISFNVHIRTPTISPRDLNPAIKAPLQRVHLKPRELGVLEWDEKLTLEFNGDHPSFQSITITPAPHIPILYLAGDSTVVDQDNEPWAAWGQMLPAFFSPTLTVANEAESGETIRSFITENRLSKILSTIQPGDFLMIQFGHNDQKPGANYVPAATDYKDFLRRYIREARAHGATPILVTSMNRRSFAPDGRLIPTLRNYPEAMREVAAEQATPLIDLNAISKTLFETLGPEGTLHAFVHYPATAFPNQPETISDDTHFNNYGAFLLAQAIVQSIRDQHLPLEPHLRPNIPPFNPTQPQPFSTFTLPPSPNVSPVTPYGR